MVPIPFRPKRLTCRSVSDGSRLLNYLYRRQSETYSAKWDRGFRVRIKHVSARLLIRRALIRGTRLKSEQYQNNNYSKP